MTYRTANEQPDPRELIRSIFEQGLSLAVLLEFFVGWAKVPFLLAFVLLPVATFLNLMAEPSATDEKQAAIVRQFATKALTVIGLGIGLYAVIYTIVNWNEFWRMETAREFLLPVLLNLLFLPFLWILLTYMAYELAHLRPRFIKPAQSRPKRVMVLLFWEFGIRYKEVKHWSLYCIKKPPSDNKSLVQSFSSSRDTRYDHDTNPSY
ncbi:hypothetical protein QEH52_00320 [Coraliomargarita sp. SDUM461003]|uniref:Uncharacterized protein n=1 Tax=Thalassobacterium maritimum TaxID=3041265 RepID=A0ABU1APG4_9BACT|nr:hypothetical protein [Coraliomargarita sp. SDUM461003]MDQ8205938.1 hypothetical protein [Coraliomargarita sp. SDUM461003]